MKKIIIVATFIALVGGGSVLAFSSPLAPAVPVSKPIVTKITPAPSKAVQPATTVEAVQPAPQPVVRPQTIQVTKPVVVTQPAPTVQQAPVTESATPVSTTPHVAYTTSPVTPGDSSSYVSTVGQCPFYEMAGAKGCVVPPNLTCNADWTVCTPKE